MQTAVSKTSPGVADKRREPRLPCQRDIHFALMDDAASWDFQPAQLVDCSAHGIGLECINPMVLGDQFVVRMQIKEEHLVLFRVQNVMHRKGKYRIGGQFIGAITDPEDTDLKAVMNALDQVTIQS